MERKIIKNQHSMCASVCVYVCVNFKIQYDF